MKKFTVKIRLLSSSLIGSAEGFGALIDSDIVFDTYGVPYIPAKRIKGCLRDSALETCEMFKLSGIKIFDLTEERGSFKIVDSLFGTPGQTVPSPLVISNFYLTNYDNLTEWLRYLFTDYGSFFHPEAIRAYFTEMRSQTAIDEKGVAKEGSLRTIRVARKGLEFEGQIELLNSEPDFIKILYFAVKNFRRFGTKRTRGFGEIECSIYENGKELNFIAELEASLCK